MMMLSAERDEEPLGLRVQVADPVDEVEHCRASRICSGIINTSLVMKNSSVMLCASYSNVVSEKDIWFIE